MTQKLYHRFNRRSGKTIDDWCPSTLSFSVVCNFVSPPVLPSIKSIRHPTTKQTSQNWPTTTHSVCLVAKDAASWTGAFSVRDSRATLVSAAASSSSYIELMRTASTDMPTVTTATEEKEAEQPRVAVTADLQVAVALAVGIFSEVRQYRFRDSLQGTRIRTRTEERPNSSGLFRIRCHSSATSLWTSLLRTTGCWAISGGIRWRSSSASTGSASKGSSSRCATPRSITRARPRTSERRRTRSTRLWCGPRPQRPRSVAATVAEEGGPRMLTVNPRRHRGEAAAVWASPGSNNTDNCQWGQGSR